MPDVETIARKYEILNDLATGGMAEVFLACQRGMDGFKKLVVIKRILKHLATDEKFVSMFLDEARTAADLRHPNIVTIFEVGEDGAGSYYIAMEYLHGLDLRSITRLRGDERLPMAVSCQVAIDIARGLHYAHEKKDLTKRPLGIIHRDVSPHNCMVTFEGYTKLVDFGIARAQTRRSHTAPGIVRGKLAYMSPEQAQGAELDPRTDLFSLGIILYELTTGKRLYEKGRHIPCQLAMTSGIPLPSTHVPDYPDELEIIVMRCLSAKPEDRWPHCKELADALEEFLAHQGIPHSPARVGDWMKDNFPDDLKNEPEVTSTAFDITNTHTMDQARGKTDETGDKKESEDAEGAEGDRTRTTKFN